MSFMFGRWFEDEPENQVERLQETNSKLRDRIAELEAEKAVSDRALELAIKKMRGDGTTYYTIYKFKEQAKQELEKEKAK